MLSVLLAAAVLQAHSLPGTQPPPAAPARAQATSGDQVEPQKVCRMEPVTGSRFPVRVCRTPRNSAANQADTREMLRQMQGLPELPARSSGSGPGF